MKLRLEQDDDHEARVINVETGLIVCKIYDCADGILVLDDPII